MLAKATQACLGLIHVTDPDETLEEPPAYLKTIEPYFQGEDEVDPYCYLGHFEEFEPDLFGSLVQKAAGVGVRTECAHCFGDPEQAINDFAYAWNPDLIALGRRGRSRLAEFSLGSVSNYTLHHAPCSIYVVHEPTTESPEKSSGQEHEVPT